PTSGPAAPAWPARAAPAPGCSPRRKRARAGAAPPAPGKRIASSRQLDRFEVAAALGLDQDQGVLVVELGQLLDALEVGDGLERHAGRAAAADADREAVGGAHVLQRDLHDAALAVGHEQVV